MASPARAKNPYQLKYNPYAYRDVQKMRNSDVSTKELRKAYSYFRQIAQKRMNRLGKAVVSGEIKELPKAAQQYAYTGVPKTKDLTDRQIIYEISELSRFITLQQSTVSGVKQYRAEKIRELRAKGIDVTDITFDGFIAYQEALRAGALRQGVNYEVLMSFLRSLRRRKIDVKEINEDFQKFLDWYQEGKLNENFAKKIGSTYKGKSAIEIKAIIQSYEKKKKT